VRPSVRQPPKTKKKKDSMTQVYVLAVQDVKGPDVLGWEPLYVFTSGLLQLSDANKKQALHMTFDGKVCLQTAALARVLMTAQVYKRVWWHAVDGRTDAMANKVLQSTEASLVTVCKHGSLTALAQALHSF
jgi:hypothetical protein